MVELALPVDVLSEELVLQLPTAPDYPSIYPQLNGLLTFQSVKLADLTEDGLYNKVVMAYDQDYLDQQIAKIPAQFKEDYEVIKTRSNLLEFMPKGVTKAFGLAHLAAHLGLTSDEIMALGDEENDLSMIEYAGMGPDVDSDYATSALVDLVRNTGMDITAETSDQWMERIVISTYDEFKAFMAALSESSVSLPISTFTSSSTQFTIFERFPLASEGSFTPFRLKVSALKAFL